MLPHGREHGREQGPKADPKSAQKREARFDALVASAIDLQVGTIATPEELGTWSEVEHPRADAEARVELTHRTWTVADTTIRWELAGLSGHHPIVELLVDVSRSSPAPIEYARAMDIEPG
jgi:hypothetical protein